MNRCDPIKKTVEKGKCTRCGFEFWPKINDKTDEIEWPKNCRNQDCNSPYWKVEKTRFLTPS